MKTFSKPSSAAHQQLRLSCAHLSQRRVRLWVRFYSNLILIGLRAFLVSGSVGRDLWFHLTNEEREDTRPFLTRSTVFLLRTAPKIATVVETGAAFGRSRCSCSPQWPDTDTNRGNYITKHRTIPHSSCCCCFLFLFETAPTALPDNPQSVWPVHRRR